MRGDAAIAGAINELAAFCGPRDVERLSQDALLERFGTSGLDVLVLFGGSIVSGAEEFARAMCEGVADRYVIVGGAGHTTQTLLDELASLVPGESFAGLTEADALDLYLRRVHGIHADLLERASTNCGNNVTNLLALLEGQGVSCESIGIIQDATMQRRMDAGLRKFAPQIRRVVNYAAYQVRAVPGASELAYDRVPLGMWPMERYVSLLMGEIPRLRDDAAGYGPRGRDYIAHVDVPADVECAFRTLLAAYPELVRKANPAFASRG